MDCTQSTKASDLTSRFPTVYRSRDNFDPTMFSESGEIDKSDFESLAATCLKSPPGNIRFKIRKNEELDVYIVTSIRMETSEQAIASAPPPVQWVSNAITIVEARSGRPNQPVTTISRPLTLSTLRTARFLLKEQQRPTSLESGDEAKASSVFGVTFKEAVIPEEETGGATAARREVYYYYRERYKLKFENSLLTLCFEDQNGNQQNVATVITGRSENWFLMAGGSVYANGPGLNDPGKNPTGIYLGLNWTPNDIFDPEPRFLIVNFLDLNTTNPSSAIGLVGLGMGFPKVSSFIPLSTLSVTETLSYNFDLSKFQLLTLLTYDVTDVLQLLKL